LFAQFFKNTCSLGIDVATTNTVAISVTFWL